MRSGDLVEMCPFCFALFFFRQPVHLSWTILKNTKRQENPKKRKKLIIPDQRSKLFVENGI